MAATPPSPSPRGSRAAPLPPPPTEASAAPPRVLFVSFTSEWSGPSNSLLHLLQHFGERLRPLVVLPGEGAFTEVLAAAGVPFRSLPSLRKSAIPALLRLIRAERIELVYGNNTSSSSENALIAARLAGVPFICHIRGMARTRGWRRLAFLRWADASIAVSAACARALLPYTGRRPPHVIHNGITPPPEADREQARATLLRDAGFPHDALVVASVGQLCRRKGQEHAIHALGRLAAAHPRMHLALLGGAEHEAAYTSALHTLAREPGVAGRVAFLGFRRDVASLLPGADIFLHTALADPHPRAVLEAMAARLPVVAFGVDGVAETVRDGESGYLVPAGDDAGLAGALGTLAADPALRRQMGERARAEVSERFSAALTAERVAAVIDDTLRRRTSRPPAARVL